MVQTLIERFIAERHGEEGVGWKPRFENSIEDPKAPRGSLLSRRSIRCITLTLADGSWRKYYFDRTRAFQATVRFYQFAGVLPKELWGSQPEQQAPANKSLGNE